MLPFEFIIEGPPVSQQTRRRRRLRQWIETVSHRAEAAWPVERLPVEGPIMVTITHLYAEVALDLDNLAKPILDAPKGLLLHDDEQVTDIYLRKRRLTGRLEVTDASPVLAAGLASEAEFLHIAIQDAPNQELLE